MTSGFPLAPLLAPLPAPLLAGLVGLCRRSGVAIIVGWITFTAMRRLPSMVSRRLVSLPDAAH